MNFGVGEDSSIQYLTDDFGLFPIPTCVNLSKIFSTLSPVLSKNVT